MFQKLIRSSSKYLWCIIIGTVVPNNNIMLICP